MAEPLSIYIKDIDKTVVASSPEEYELVLSDLDAEGRDYESFRMATAEEAAPKPKPPPREIEGLANEASDQNFKRDVKRVAGQALSKRPATFLPGESTPLSRDTFGHYEPSISKLLKTPGLSAEDIELLSGSDAKETPLYKALVDKDWQLVHDVHQKHNLPVVRVSEVGGMRGAYGKIDQNVSVPVMVGFDTLRTFGTGRHAMGAAVDMLSASAAEQELVKMGVLSPTAERLEEIGEDSLAATILGSALGAAGGAGRALAVGGAKMAELLGGGVIAGTAAAGTIATGEAVAEEAVETVSEDVRGVEHTPMSGTELAMRGVMGGALGGAGEAIGGVARGMVKRLRKPAAGASGAEELAQMESLTGQRGTRVGGSGYKAAGVVEEELETIAEQRTAAALGGTPAVASIESKLTGVAERVAKAVNDKSKKLKIEQQFESDMYYASREGGKATERIDSIPAMLREELTRRQMLSAPAKASGGPMWLMSHRFQQAKPDVPKVRDAPLMDNKQIKNALKEFEGIEKMTALELDTALKGVDELMLKNRKVLASNQFLKNLQYEMREVRDRFVGNSGTGNRSWGRVKRDQASAIEALENAKRRIGQQAEGKIDVGNEQSVGAIVNSMHTLGLDQGGKVPDSSILKVLEEMDPKLLKEFKDWSSFFPRDKLSAMGGGVALYPQAMARAAMQPSTFVRADPFMSFMAGQLHNKSAKAGVIPAMLSGTGSERAQAQLVTDHAKIETMKRMGMAAQQLPDEEEE